MLVDIYNLELDFLENIEYKMKSLEYSLLEAVLEYSEEKNIDLEMLADFIKKYEKLTIKLEKEAQSLNLIKNDKFI